MDLDGVFVGFNKDIMVKFGGKMMYKWKVINVGVSFFLDLGNILFSEEGSNFYGLFGVFFV